MLRAAGGSRRWVITPILLLCRLMKITTELSTDPFLLLSQDDPACDVDDVDLFELATRAFEPRNPAPLIALLMSESALVRGRGLFIFGKLGAKASEVVDEAIRSASDERFTARSSLMDGLIHKPQRLSANQVRIVLGLAADPHDLVRSKVVALLREVNIEVLGEAIAGLAVGRDQAHKDGCSLLVSPDQEPQALFDEGAMTTGIRSTYCLAAVERMAKSGLLNQPPELKQDSWIGESTLAQVRRLIGRRISSREELSIASVVPASSCPD
jgi:hypothetical protein